MIRLPRLLRGMKLPRLSPRLALPALAACLALLFAIELLAPEAGGSEDLRAPVIPAAATDDQADSMVAQWSGAILSRPLFSPSRRPAAQGGDDSSPAELPRLTAIIDNNGAFSAIFAADGQKPQVARAGAEIDGYKLWKITSGAVEMLGPAGPVTLHLQFAPPAQAAGDSSGGSSS